VQELFHVCCGSVKGGGWVQAGGVHAEGFYRALAMGGDKLGVTICPFAVTTFFKPWSQRMELIRT
jgi:hypothetical protein